VPVKVVHALVTAGAGLKTLVNEAPFAPSKKRRTLNTAPGCKSTFTSNLIVIRSPDLTTPAPIAFV
jgi:hypothetical protein